MALPGLEVETGDCGFNSGPQKQGIVSEMFKIYGEVKKGGGREY
jgi:hypothetical protein